MAEVTQFSFAWPEVTEMLIKKADIHEGQWLAIAEFGINAGIMGVTPTDAKPGVAILLTKLQLMKADANAPPSLVLDASKVNPSK